jgi:hypothetical protein
MQRNCNDKTLIKEGETPHHECTFYVQDLQSLLRMLTTVKDLKTDGEWNRNPTEFDNYTFSKCIQSIILSLHKLNVSTVLIIDIIDYLRPYLTNDKLYGKILF